MEEINIKIYVLIDPISKEVRYVGKTIQSLNKRLTRHLWESKVKKTITHKINWIRKLQKNNLKPEILLIKEKVDVDFWGETERNYIKLFKKLGCDLTNSTDGGEGMHGFKMSDEQKKKISESNKGKIISRETREYLSIINKGKKLSDETKKKISESKKGTITSEKTKKLLRKLNKENGNNFLGKTHSKETREKMSKSAKKRKKNNLRSVKQIDRYTEEIIKIWESATEAGRVLGIGNKGICKICRGHKKTYKGYKWEYN